MVESTTDNCEVAGSNPVSPTKFGIQQQIQLLLKIAAEWHVGSSPTKYVCTNTDGGTGRHGYHTNKKNSSIN